MYSISETAELTGVSAFTLRYYEKIGLLPSPKRQNGKKDGIRRYTDKDLHFIRFITGLKQTGMPLKDIAMFAEGGCVLLQDEEERVEDVAAMFAKRIDILESHLEQMDRQMEEMKQVKILAEKKKKVYEAFLLEEIQKRKGV
ncbi:MerR family transcriptional regulator [Shimazuella sp. AN120528]|nr:MerR family transcriptional regulator [Shimazuella soli]